MDKKEKTGVLNVRDLVNVGLFSVLIFIATFLSGMIGFIPVLMPVVPFVYGIVSGPVYMLYFTKIKKAGMLFIQTIVVTLAFVATGHGPWVLLTAVIGGLLGEVVLRNGRYKSVKHARLAFSVQSIYGLGNWLPIYFARDAYIRQMLDMGYGEEYTQKMMSVLPNWTLPLIVILGMLGAYIKAEKDGATGRETFVITVQRDTDGDGEPDITDTDDDGDGFTDIEEEEKGTDPKDPNSVPQVDPKPVKPDQKQDPEISQNKVVNNVVNNSYKKPISNAPKTGDFGNGTGYTGLAALAAGLMLLLGIKKKRKEEDGEE